MCFILTVEKICTIGTAAKRSNRKDELLCLHRWLENNGWRKHSRIKHDYQPGYTRIKHDDQPGYTCLTVLGNQVGTDHSVGIPHTKRNIFCSKYDYLNSLTWHIKSCKAQPKWGSLQPHLLPLTNSQPSF